MVAAYQAERSVREDKHRSVADLPRGESSGKGRFTALELVPVDNAGNELNAPLPGCDMLVKTHIDCASDFSEANVCVVLFDGNGNRIIDVNTALRGEFLSMKRGECATVNFYVREVLLKPGIYTVTLWLGRGGVEDMDHVEDAGTWEVRDDPSGTTHTQSFPGCIPVADLLIV